MRPKLSVIVPALNEEKNLRATIEAIKRSASACSGPVEIIVINDGSDDETGTIADEVADRVIHHAQVMGIGTSYFEGVAVSSGEYVLLIPGDNEIEESSVRLLLSNVGLFDLVTTFIDNQKARSLKRRMLSKGFSEIAYLISGVRLRSFSGTTIYPASLLRKYDFRATGFGYNAEILATLIRSGISYKEVPIRIKSQPGRKSRAFNIKNVFDIGVTFLRIMRQRLASPCNVQNGTAERGRGS